MSSTDGWLKEQIKGLRRQPGGAAGYGEVKTGGTLDAVNGDIAPRATPATPRPVPAIMQGPRGALDDQPVALAQAGDTRAENFLQQSGMRTNSVGAPSIVQPAASNPVDSTILNGVKNPLDRRGPNMGVPPEKRSEADDLPGVEAAGIFGALGAGFDKVKNYAKGFTKGSGAQPVVDAVADAAKGATSSIREAASKVTPAAAGRAAAHTVNAAEAIPGAVKDAAAKAQEGYRSVRPEAPEASTARGARAASPEAAAHTASRGTFPGGQPLPSGPTAPAKPGLVGRGLRAVGSKVGNFAKAAGAYAVPFAGMAGAYDGFNTPTEQYEKRIGAGQSDSSVDSPALRGLRDMGVRAAGIATDIGYNLNPLNLLPDSLNPMGPGPDKSPIDRRGANFGVPPGGVKSQGSATAIPTDQGPQEPRQLIEGTAVPAPGYGAFQRTGGGPHNFEGDRPGAEGVGPVVGLRPRGVAGFEGTKEGAERDYLRIQAQREANVQAAPPQAGGTGVSIGGLRGQAGGPRNAMEAIGRIAAYGAATRLAKNAADVGLREDAINVAREANLLTAASNTAKLRREDEKQGNERLDQVVRNAATERAGPVQTSMTGKELSATHKADTDKIYARMRGDVDYTVGKAKMKPGDMSTSQVQMLMTLAKLKDRAEVGRESKTQWARDFFGNKRFDSRDLTSYVPSKAEGSIIPFSGGYKITLANGNSVSVSAAAGGGFNFTGPNDPMDADVMALMAPAIREYEQKVKDKRK